MLLLEQSYAKFTLDMTIDAKVFSCVCLVTQSDDGYNVVTHLGLQPK